MFSVDTAWYFLLTQGQHCFPDTMYQPALQKKSPTSHGVSTDNHDEWEKSGMSRYLLKHAYNNTLVSELCDRTVWSSGGAIRETGTKSIPRQINWVLRVHNTPFAWWDTPHQITLYLFRLQRYRPRRSPSRWSGRPEVRLYWPVQQLVRATLSLGHRPRQHEGNSTDSRRPRGYIHHGN